MRPGSDGKLYFSRFDWEPTIQYGADLKRGASFAVSVDVEIPDSAVLQREPRGGVPNALIIVTATPLRALVKELFIREPHATGVTSIKGADAIAQYLKARQGRPARGAGE
jgi:hypothetical protein